MKLLTFLAVAAGAVTAANGDPGLAAKSVNEFGVELHQRLAAKADANLCASPYSIQTALAMTFAGAEGETRAEMAKVLHLGTDESIHKSFGALQAAIEQSATKTVERARKSKEWGGPTEPLALTVANRLFGQSGYEFRKPFLNLVETVYRAPLEQLDFAASPGAATKRINGWVEDQTRKKIRDLLPPNLLTKDTGLVLVNAIYMKAPWAEEFSARRTKPAPFHVRGTTAKDVPTMVRQDHYGYVKRDGYAAVALPYIGGEVQFVVIVPDDVKGLAEVEKKLSAADLAACAELKPRDVILHLPKFKMEPPSVMLAEELQAMGMKKAFDIPEGSANFERMAPRKPNDYLCISEVVHKTFIAVDEKGTEAAAATAVVMLRAGAAAGERPKPVEVKVDRPFLFAIQHRPSGACLFLGRVVDPG